MGLRQAGQLYSRPKVQKRLPQRAQLRVGDGGKSATFFVIDLVVLGVSSVVLSKHGMVLKVVALSSI